MTPFTKEDIKAMGLFKIDLLGLRNLTIIHDTLASIRERTGKLIDLSVVLLTIRIRSMPSAAAIPWAAFSLKVWESAVYCDK